MSDCVFAIVGDGFVLMAADTSANQSIIRMKTGEDKILEATSHMLLVGFLPSAPNYSKRFFRRCEGDSCVIRDSLNIET
jgi:20S proteasome alpha/beta subunit